MRTKMRALSGVVILVLFLPASAAVAQEPPAFGCHKPVLSTNLGGLPLPFVENRGQGPEDVAFLGTNLGSATVGLGWGGEARLWLAPADDPAAGGSEVILRPPGSAGKPSPEANLPLPGTTTVLVGSASNPAASWLTAFERVSFPGLIKGIELSYRGDGRRLVLELEAAPGADLSALRFGLSGVELLSGRDAFGALRFQTSDPLRQRLQLEAPTAWQGSPPEAVEVQAVFEGGALSFALGPHDSARPETKPRTASSSMRTALSG